MPNKKFLEEYPLYRKCPVDGLTNYAVDLPRVRIKMACPVCKSEQTFAMQNKYTELHAVTLTAPVGGNIFRLQYLCGHCEEQQRIFLVAVAPDRSWLMKVGQYPAWDISGNRQVESMLGTHSDYYRKGLICESQGFGIGAFGYYRRIVEEVIDQLLDQISELMTGEELNQFQLALAKAKNTIVAQEKIELVKDLLPAILRPKGMNPLALLHSALSEGLHAETDESCLERADSVRCILVFLVNQVAVTKTAGQEFTEGMRKLLEKKAAKGTQR